LWTGELITLGKGARDMGQKSGVASQMKKIETDQLIVSPNVFYEHAQSLFDPIARRAYEIFESRGGAHGHDWEDWYRAEVELLQPVNVELSDSGDALLAIADVTGYRPEDLRVSVEPQYLRICGRSSEERKHSAKSEEELRRLDGFFVSFDLPTHIKTSQVSADVTQDDLLKIRLPKMLRQSEVEANADIRN
jgi:HSP20 family molecular chaperone IbpA